MRKLQHDLDAVQKIQRHSIELVGQHECAAAVMSLATTHITRAIAVSVSVYTDLASPSTASIEHLTHTGHFAICDAG